MQCVPFLEAWTGSESRLDIKAIYRRPGKGIDLTGGLPVRRHSQWCAKGFTYVSLASVKDVNEAAKSLREHGLTPTDFQSAYTKEGAFDVAQYVREATKDDAARLAELRAKVEKFGADAVVEMMRMSDPTFELPAGLIAPPAPADMASDDSKKEAPPAPIASAAAPDGQKGPRK